ncbi:targeting protein for Xklp2 [Copidosoma floridanum]|uniref:targeting protein for Xklp2 n=1 Tax=Copidosoma floridanum TaxID=29053 RepID=UPI0006C96CAB|nr:targeting protein for Xklp2 [Copidosoma floridanum]
MDNLDAPQWADFIAPSPQVTQDDFFLRQHEAHEYRCKSDLADFDQSPNHSVKSNLSKHALNESCVNDTIFEKTPKPVKSNKGRTSSCRKSRVKEVTHEDALTEAMKNLQLSMQKYKGDKSMNKSCLMDSPTTFKTPQRVTRSMCASMNTPKHDLDESHYVSFEQDKLEDEHDHDGIDKNEENVHTKGCNHVEVNIRLDDECEPIDEKERKTLEQDQDSSTNEQTSQIKLEVSETSLEPDTSDEKVEPEPEPEIKVDDAVQDNQSKHLPKSKIVTSFDPFPASKSNDSKKKIATLTGNAWHRQVKRHVSLTNQRRLSMSKNLATSKYVSMAEAVTKFQRTTPQRFHSVNVKSTKAELLKKQSLKLTRATSPALMCKKRTRPVTAMSREEREKLELEKIRQNQIKANPVRKDILKKPAPLKKVEKKLVTYPEPFHLTQTRKDQPPDFKLNQTQEFKRARRVPAKTVPTIVSTKEKSVVIKEEEVLYFGIPLDPVNMKKKTTKIMPFSFEARNRELQAKKKEKLQKLKESEQQKNKSEFHARPVPTAVKTPCRNLSAPKAASANKAKKITIARTLSFDDRNREMQKKKEERIKQMMEEEKKLRTFKAQKVPEFKPVLVRGRSKDSLHKKSNENLVTKPQNEIYKSKVDNVPKKENFTTVLTNNIPVTKKTYANSMKNLIKKTIPFVAPKKVSPSSTATENQENKNNGPVPKILEPKCKLSQKSVSVLTELNTDKRAKQRKDFEEQMKKKEAEEAELKKEEEREKLEREKAENIELRKKMEVKARPMPVFKPPSIIKSNKPLTEAQSPHWAKPKASSSID